MSKGCIVDSCFVCKELIWEDEEIIVYKDYLIHENCLLKAKRIQRIIKYV